MPFVVEFPIHSNREFDQFAEKYFQIYYLYKRAAIKKINSQLDLLYKSEAWNNNKNLVHSIMFLTSKSENGIENKQIPAYTLAQVQDQIIHIFNGEKNKSLLTKLDIIKAFDSETSDSQEINDFSRAALSLLATNRQWLRGNYNLKTGAVPISINVRALVASTNNKFAQDYPWFSKTMANILLATDISKSLDAVFDKKNKHGTYKHLSSRAPMNLKTLQFSAFNGSDLATPMKIDWDAQIISIGVRRPNGNKTNGKIQHVAKLYDYDEYRQRLIDQEFIARQVYSETKSSKDWFFKFPTLVRKVLSNGRVRYFLQVTYSANRPALVHHQASKGSIGVSVSTNTIATWSTNPNGLRIVNILNPYFKESFYDNDGQLINGESYRKTLQQSASEQFLADNVQFMEPASKKDSQPAEEGKFHFKKGMKKYAIRSSKFKHCRNLVSYFDARKTRIRKQLYETLGNEILASGLLVNYADSVNHMISTMYFPQILADDSTKLKEDKATKYHDEINFAPASLKTMLIRKLAFHGCQLNDLTKFANELYDLNGRVPFERSLFIEINGKLVLRDLYHAFLLAHVDENQSKDVVYDSSEFEELVQVNREWVKSNEARLAYVWGTKDQIKNILD